MSPDPEDSARARGLATRAVWSGEARDGPCGTPTQVPIVRSAAFGYASLDRWLGAARGELPGHIYSRNANPTVAAFEDKVRDLEGAAAATSFSTGMAAVAGVLFGLLRPGDRVVSIRDTYGGTAKLFTEFLPRWGVSVELCDTNDGDGLDRAIAAGCRLVYLESPTNPTLKVVDLARHARAARAAGAVVAVDNTFATPVNTNPLSLGADLVLHSATKFLGGHGDVLGGIVCGSADLVGPIHHYREITGAALDPEAAFLLVRGLKTLVLRVERQNASAVRIAAFLERHPAVEAVFYPGLASHPSHQVARRQMRGFGGLVSFSVRGGLTAMGAVLARLRLVHLAANLGAVESVAGPPATTSHVECSPEERAALGIPEALIRYSVGVEDPEDLIADLTQALER